MAPSRRTDFWWISIADRKNKPTKIPVFLENYSFQIYLRLSRESKQLTFGNNLEINNLTMKTMLTVFRYNPKLFFYY